MSHGVLRKVRWVGPGRFSPPSLPPHLGSTSGACVGVPQALEHKLAREPWGVGGVFGGGGLGGGWAHPCAILAQAGVTASPPSKVRKIIGRPHARWVSYQRRPT